MKKPNKKVTTEKLSLHKFSIARLNQMNAIKGGAHTNKNVTPLFNGEEAYESIVSIDDTGSDFFPIKG